MKTVTRKATHMGYPVDADENVNYGISNLENVFGSLKTVEDALEYARKHQQRHISVDDLVMRQLIALTKTVEVLATIVRADFVNREQTK